MNFEEIRASIESRIATWAGAPIAWDGVPASEAAHDAQSAKQPWVRVSIIDGDSFTAAIGDGPRVRRTGVIICQIFTARDTGTRPARALASSLAERIEYWQSGTLSTEAARLINVGPDDNYQQFNLQCPFRAG
jgi:hypothetical protein